MECQTLTRRQRELLAVALAIANGSTNNVILRTIGFHRASAAQCLRKLSHLRLKRPELNQLAASTPPAELPNVLLRLFVERKVETRARRKAARKAERGQA